MHRRHLKKCDCTCSLDVDKPQEQFAKSFGASVIGSGTFCEISVKLAENPVKRLPHLLAESTRTMGTSSRGWEA